MEPRPGESEAVRHARGCLRLLAGAEPQATAAAGWKAEQADDGLSRQHRASAMITILVLVALVLLAFLIPPRFDPAIRLREWSDRHE